MANSALAQFFVVIRNGAALNLQRIPVTAALQKELGEEFLKQMGEFLDQKEKVDFAPSYQPSKHEVSQIKGYTAPTFLQQAVASPHNFQSLTMPFTPSAPWVRAVLAAIPPHSGGQSLYLFQYFDRRRILDTERTLIFRKGTFGRLRDPGVVIGQHLDAVIQGTKLFFHSFHLASQFLPLHDYFVEATDEDIREFVSHRLFAGGKAAKVIEAANDVTRKRVSMVLKAGVLDSAAISADGIKAVAKKFDLELTLKGRAGKRQVVFPDQSADVRDLLHLLTEGFYTGPISGEPYVANSYRKLK